ncbi:MULTISPECIES: phage tail spike protein [Bacillus]|uniref:phage tail spike protein n=1 Tax=Bacillus TaxID=1386 RepID=UPI0002AAA6ED|nr:MULTISPECIES: phage tail spike protein [Bacillus]MCE4147384.1 phage tail protein [Bacillus velezensis]MDV9183958.1 phage tail spike protein [Bacillus sp. 31]ULH19028.1 phage tail protein [Bacillus velezensis]ULN61974.1 phage tail protein [Bacillus velezensis]ULN62026.1 phage tail protein [Bacillus velezensis]
MADIYILSPDDKLLTVLSSHGRETCTFWDAKYKEELNKGSSFSFVADASHPDARFLFEENQVVFRDKDGVLRLFVIKELDDADEEGEVNTQVTCEAAMMELAETFVKDFRPTNKTAQFVLDNVLSRSRWVAEVTAELGVNSTTFYKKTALDCIADVINIWGGELQDTIEFDGNKVVKRIIKILPRRGKDSGKRFESDKDTTNIRRTVISYPVTALWGYGASIASTDEEGEETGGYSRFIDFSEVEWKKSKGDPVDKPLGQEWVGDPDLLERLGRLKDGKLIHREGQYNDEDITEPEELLKATYNHLITTACKTEINYELSVQLLESVPGHEHEHVELGDTTIAIDRNFAIPIETSQRVISMEYDITDPENTCVVEIGQFLSALQKDGRIDQIESVIEKNRGTWESKPDAGEVTDGSFPDKAPPVPSNVVIKAMFQNVALTWDYDPSSFIAAYEVYASQVNGFTPLKENRIYRGKTGGCEHFTGVNEVWYYRLRSINTRGTESEFTDQFSATTQRILTDDIVFGAITKEKLADLAVDADKLSRNFDDANILPGSLLDSNWWYAYSGTKYTIDKKEFNEMTISQDGNKAFGVCQLSVKQTMSLVKDQVYTLSFEVKRNNTTDISWNHLKKGSTFISLDSSGLTDISNYPADEFKRVNIQFTAPETGNNYTIGLGGRGSDDNSNCSYVVRKIQVRKGAVIKEYGYSPYDVALVDGVITNNYLANLAVGSANIQSAAITSAKIADAAVGSAAIANAAIKKAHLGTAIIDTAHIIDGSITNAKIQDLSADKINVGTLKGITIEGVDIKGARFEALTQSEDAEYYIEGDKIYQFTRDSHYDYNKLVVSSAKITQEQGRFYDPGDSSNEIYRTVSIGDGKIELRGAGEQTAYETVPTISMYSEIGDVGQVISHFNMKMERQAAVEEDAFLLTATTNPKNIGEPFTYNRYQALFEGSATIYRFKPNNLDIDVPGVIRLKSGQKTIVDASDLTLPLGTKVVAGNAKNCEFKLMGGNVSTELEDEHGGLQYGLMVYCFTWDIKLPPDGGATAYARYNRIPFVDSFDYAPENVFAAVGTAIGAYSNAVTVGLENISASSVDIGVRGTGTTAGVAGKTIKVQIVIFYESQ